MATVLRWVLLAAVLLIAPVAAESPEDAASLWDELYGETWPGAVESVTFNPENPVAGSQFEAVIQFADGVQWHDVRYQICAISEGYCFAANITLDDLGGGAWRLYTGDIPDRIERDGGVPDLRGNERYGIQFFIYNSSEPDDFVMFPEGLDYDHEWFTSTEQGDFIRWFETHYFGVDVVPGAKTTPAPSVLLLVAAVAVAALVRRD